MNLTLSTISHHHLLWSSKPYQLGGRAFFLSGVCHAHSSTIIIAEICKRGTFHFTLDLMPAHNLEPGQPIQIS